MILRCVCWSIFLCLALEPTVKAQVTVDDQGYQNVLISFEPNVPSEDGKDYIEEIQDILERTSNVLNKAIGIPIASATFLLPSSWPTETWKNITVNPATAKQTARRSDILVDATEDSPFVHQPVALQHGGCGVPGHQIILNLNFIGDPKYPEGNIVAREWLKYRYGVFEENGFHDDDLYPNFYKVPGKSEVKVTDCTNSKVKYIFKLHDSVCAMDSEGDFGSCTPYPDEKSAAIVTSSLMYFNKDLTKMEHVCGKDGYPHDSTAPNKQNVLCNGRSIWDVIRSSEDFKKIQKQPTDIVPKPIKFSYIQESKPRFVVLLENSDNLHEKETPSAILFTLRRLYYDLPPKSKLAIYTYNSDVSVILPFAELSDKSRSDLGAIADFATTPTTPICTSCGLAKATEILLKDSEVEKGSILLFTASPLDKVPELSEKLRETGTCLHVFRFTEDVDQSYDALAHKFGCYTYMGLQGSLEYLFNSVTASLKNNVLENHGYDLERKIVVSGSMLAQTPVTIPPDSTAVYYTLWLGKTLTSSSIECKTGDTLVTLKPDKTGTDISSFTFEPKNNNITCKLSSAKHPPILALVQMTTHKGEYLVFDTWIHDKSTEQNQLPIIVYAKIYFGAYPVKNANVTMVVSLGHKQEIVRMLDNGRGDPDVTEYDGIYSGYVTEFLQPGHYEINVKINNKKGQATIGKAFNSLVPACCGSKIMSENHGVPAFEVEKIILYSAKNKRPADGYPPSRIVDLHAMIVKDYPNVILAWSAPGGGKAAKYVIKLFENREDAVKNFDTGRELNSSSMVPQEIGTIEGFVIPFKGLDENVTYFAAIRSQNEFNKQSEISNVAEFVPKFEKEKPTSSTPAGTTPPGSTTTPGSTTDGGITKNDPPKSSNKTVAIVFGVLGGIAFLCIVAYLGYYFFVKKPRRN